MFAMCSELVLLVYIRSILQEPFEWWKECPRSLGLNFFHMSTSSRPEINSISAKLLVLEGDVFDTDLSRASSIQLKSPTITIGKLVVMA